MLASKGWRLQDNVSYEGTHVKIGVICSMGHKSSMKPHNIKHGHNCAECAGHSVFYSSIRFYELLEDINYKLQPGSRYEKHHKKVNLTCDKGHVFSINPGHLFRGVRCGVCFDSAFTSTFVKSPVSRAAHRTKSSAKTSLTFEEIVSLIDPNIKTIYSAVRPNKGEVVDHIIPFSWFDLSNPLEIKACWSVDNLQIVSRSYNASKKNRITEKDLAKILDSDVLRRLLQVASKRKINLIS